MKRWVTCMTVVIVLVFSVSALHASEPARLFVQGVAAYEEEDYHTAVRLFSTIADTGIRNGELYYNLGNAYLKNGDLGRALLWYERAAKLMPGDPDLSFNRDYALSLTRDEPPDDDKGPARIFFFWNYLFSSQTIQKTALILNGVFWLLLGVYTRYRKRIIRLFLPVVLVLSLIFCLTAWFNFNGGGGKKEAIILQTEVSVRSGLGDDTAELFILHAGSRVMIQKIRGSYFQIRYSQDKMGWIKKGEAEII